MTDICPPIPLSDRRCGNCLLMKTGAKTFAGKPLSDAMIRHTCIWNGDMPIVARRFVTDTRPELGAGCKVWQDKNPRCGCGKSEKQFILDGKVCGKGGCGLGGDM